jgi:hypothetical protein
VFIRGRGCPKANNQPGSRARTSELSSQKVGRLRTPLLPASSKTVRDSTGLRFISTSTENSLHASTKPSSLHRQIMKNEAIKTRHLANALKTKA